jgi:hypothetical protein
MGGTRSEHVVVLDNCVTPERRNTVRDDDMEEDDNDD